MKYSNKSIQTFKDFLPSVGIAIILVLLIDLFIGKDLLKQVKPENKDIENIYRIQHPIFHHTLKENYDGYGEWGNDQYRMCTDANGFKASCYDKKNHSLKSYDIAFIGDSFTEGVGLVYEDTFVGRISKSLQELNVANLAVSSYSPSIYLEKISYLLEHGFKFKEVIVYIDISDIQDEAIYYRIQDGKVIDAPGVKKSERWISNKKHMQEMFPLVYTALQQFKKYAFSLKTRINLPERSAWTYNHDSAGYGTMGINGAIEKSMLHMQQLYDLLDKNNISLSVGVYPWPAQLLHDQRNSLQTKLWKEFCQSRCKNFYDSFPTFFDKRDQLGSAATIDAYFIKNDLHHNKLGAELVALDFLKQRKNPPLN